MTSEQQVQREKSINLQIFVNLFKYCLKTGIVKTIFTPVVFEILWFESKSVLGTAQSFLVDEKIRFSTKNQRNAWILLNLL